MEQSTFYLSEIISYLNVLSPISLQENYDNCGLLIHPSENPITGILTTLDCTEKVVDEAIENNLNLIIAHHPIIFQGLKKISLKNNNQKALIKAIKNNINIFAIHTNLDNIIEGVNQTIAKKINLTNYKVLNPKSDTLKKLVTFVPKKHAEKIRNALFEAGAGDIGNYSHCSFNNEGTGTFLGNKNTNPTAGIKNKLHNEPEIKIETIFYTHNKNKIIETLIKEHPYEEVAFDIYPLMNTNKHIGSGILGELKTPMLINDFFNLIKKQFNLKVIKHTKITKPKISKIAICGGSGSFLLKNAITQNADVFISADFKYHEYFEANKQIIILDIGHYESEQFTKFMLTNYLKEKLPNFAIQSSKINTNPVNYFL